MVDVVMSGELYKRIDRLHSYKSHVDAIVIGQLAAAFLFLAYLFVFRFVWIYFVGLAMCALIVWIFFDEYYIVREWDRFKRGIVVKKK